MVRGRRLRLGSALLGSALTLLAGCAHKESPDDLAPLPRTGANGDATPRTDVTLLPAGPAGATYARARAAARAPPPGALPGRMARWR